MQKIIVAGSSNTDMVLKVPRIPAPGETILGTEFFIIPGGKGANQAVAAARTGSEVIFIACVADDSMGMQSIENYTQDGINTSFIKIQKGTHSGVALINVSDEGENCITVAPGANKQLLPKDIRKARESFHGASVVLAQLEIPIETVEEIADTARSLNIPFILNPAPAAKLSPELLNKITVITPNETEAALLTLDMDISPDNIPAMASYLHDAGVNTVIITLGSKGVFVKSVDFTGFISGFKVTAVDTTAAGDVFNGALASGLARKWPLKEAIDYAQKAAAISVTRLGAQPSAPLDEEILKFNL
jgi:ribokinase